jgi:sugar phosphate isomerase/epimerase
MTGFDERKLSRREALALIGGLAASCTTIPKSTPQAKGGSARIALQMYTLRTPAAADLAGTLKKAREIGWEYVQWSGMPNLSAEKIREALDAAGLKAIAAHCGVEPFETDFDNQVQFWKTVGATYVGPGGMMGDCSKSLEGWLKGAARLDAVGAKLRSVGLRLAYHNHSGEFEKFPEDPRCKLDILFEKTSPENLSAELDLAWVQVGGADPAAYIRKYKGRCPTVHAKDLEAAGSGRKVQFAPLGQGILNWPDIFKAGKEAGIEWYIYEQDSCKGDVFEAVKTSYEFLKKNVG